MLIHIEIVIKMSQYIFNKFTYKYYIACRPAYVRLCDWHMSFLFMRVRRART